SPGGGKPGRAAPPPGGCGGAGAAVALSYLAQSPGTTAEDDALAERF
ncbi:hypothetical protein ABIC08_008474, partial [Bradyrhizobium sp. RT9b]